MCQCYKNVALHIRVLRSQGITHSPDQFLKTETKEFLAVKTGALCNDIVNYRSKLSVSKKNIAVNKTTFVEECFEVKISYFGAQPCWVCSKIIRKECTRNIREPCSSQGVADAGCVNCTRS